MLHQWATKSILQDWYFRANQASKGQFQNLWLITSTAVGKVAEIQDANWIIRSHNTVQRLAKTLTIGKGLSRKIRMLSTQRLPRDKGPNLPSFPTKTSQVIYPPRIASRHKDYSRSINRSKDSPLSQPSCSSRDLRSAEVPCNWTRSILFSPQNLKVSSSNCSSISRTHSPLSYPTDLNNPWWLPSKTARLFGGWTLIETTNQSRLNNNKTSSTNREHNSCHTPMLPWAPLMGVCLHRAILRGLCKKSNKIRWSMPLWVPARWTSISMGICCPSGLPHTWVQTISKWLKCLKTSQWTSALCLMTLWSVSTPGAITGSSSWTGLCYRCAAVCVPTDWTWGKSLATQTCKRLIDKILRQ